MYKFYTLFHKFTEIQLQKLLQCSQNYVQKQVINVYFKTLFFNEN